MELLTLPAFEPGVEQAEEIVLSQFLTRDPLRLNEALGYGYEIATALKRIHENGSICESLDPSKIVLLASGAVMIAQEPAVASGLSPQVSPYLAPEQLEGKPGDARVDVFAFGAVLYEMLTGRRAFDGNTAEEVRTAILRVTPELFGGVEDTWETSAQVRSGVAHLVGMCLEKNAGKRYSSAQKILVELKLLLISVKVSEPRRRVRKSRTEAALRAQIDELEGQLSVGRSLCDGRTTELEARMTLLEETFSSATEQMQVASQAVATVCTALAQLEENLNQRLDSHEASVDELQKSIAENRAELRKTSAEYNAGLESTRTWMGALDGVLSARIGGLEQGLQSQNDSIKSLETSCSQIDDLMGRTLEALDSLVEVAPE